MPQLWSILKGDMSFVGPRPALFNQDDLIKLKTEKEISKLQPGITGWAQINGRDDILIPIKVRPLQNSSISHSGLDQESRKYLIILDSGFRDCVAITLYYFVEKRGLLKLCITNFFKNLGVKPFLKISIFSLFSNFDTVSSPG